MRSRFQNTELNFDFLVISSPTRAKLTDIVSTLAIGIPTAILKFVIQRRRHHPGLCTRVKNLKNLVYV